MRVADMHCDTISEIYNKGIKGKCCINRNNLHIDSEKMIRGNYLLQCFALHVDLKKTKNPLVHCLNLIDLFYEQINADKSRIAPVLCFDDIKKNRSRGKISALLTIEDGGATNNSLAQLRNFYRLGVRMLTLTWNYKNGIGYPNIRLNKKNHTEYKAPDTVNGLTEFGLKFIDEMERMGMIIDVSHLSDAGVYMTLDNTRKPIVASHSNARAVCGHARNLTDDMIRRLSEKGGVIGINFSTNLLKDTEKEANSLDGIIENIKHIAAVGGYECIGLGSDFDGIETNRCVPDASYLPKLYEKLKKTGLTRSQIDAIFHKNVLRVLKEVLKKKRYS